MLQERVVLPQRTYNKGWLKLWFILLEISRYDDSFNTSSLTDTAQGRFTIVFNNDFSNANYSASFMMGNNGTTTTGRSMHIDDTPATGQLAVRTVSNESDATNTSDDPNNMATFHGDLA